MLIIVVCSFLMPTVLADDSQWQYPDMFTEDVQFAIRDYKRENNIQDDSDIVVTQEDYPNRFNKEYLENVVEDSKAILLSPKDWTQEEWTTATAVIGATALAYVFDDKIRQWVKQDDFESGTNMFTQVTDVFGNPTYVLPSLAIAYGIGRYNDDEHLITTTLQAAEALGITYLIIGVTKALTFRSRPREGLDAKDSWYGSDNSFNETSFFSGHIGGAMAIARIVQEQYPQKKTLHILMYSAAVLTGISRMQEDAHWASEIVLGGAVGYLAAEAVIKLNKHVFKISSPKSDYFKKVKVIPVITGDRGMLFGTFKF